MRRGYSEGYCGGGGNSYLTIPDYMKTDDPFYVICPMCGKKLKWRKHPSAGYGYKMLPNHKKANNG